LADDFKTNNGREYKNATVSRVEPNGIVIKFPGMIDGVAAAQQYATAKKASVNPRTQRYSLPAPQSISFDVAITAAKGTKTQGGIAVFTGAFGLGSKGQSERSNETINRIQFSVPISLPIGAHPSGQNLAAAPAVTPYTEPHTD
jgi:hypothetical protein